MFHFFGILVANSLWKGQSSYVGVERFRSSLVSYLQVSTKYSCVADSVGENTEFSTKIQELVYW